MSAGDVIDIISEGMRRYNLFECIDSSPSVVSETERTHKKLFFPHTVVFLLHVSNDVNGKNDGASEKRDVFSSVLSILPVVGKKNLTAARLVPL